MKSVILRDYQADIMNKLSISLKTQKEVVIAACPSSGKTEMAIWLIQQNPKAKFLVLTHGTNILKAQWRDRFKDYDMVCSENLGETNVTFGLPQSFNKKTKNNKVDYLIIDEAHEFTFAQMVKNLKLKVNPKKIIYLTGTPSKFIKLGYTVLCIPALQMIQEGHVSDLYIGLVSTNAKIKETDRNQEGDIKGSRKDKLVSSVNSDMDELLDAMQERLKGIFKNSPHIKKLTGWLPTLTELHKTMIACHSIEQANKVHLYFINKKINAVISHSENDVDTLEIQKFIDDKSIRVLVVVDRGILGFNMPKMVNVVDLTCSMNINRIYQLYARVMRKDDEYPNKYFFKFTTDDQKMLMRFYMNAALNLMKEDFLMKYNGVNLNGMKLPVAVNPRKNRNGKVSGTKVDRTRSAPIDAIYFDTVQAGAMLIDIHNKIGQSANEYAYTTFGNIKHKLFGSRTPDIVNITEENLKYMIKHGKVDERIYG